jgi:hypothetical protein
VWFVVLKNEKAEWEAFIKPVEEFGAKNEKDLNTFLSTVQDIDAVKFDDVFALVQV